jgi:hypothetical protein
MSESLNHFPGPWTVHKDSRGRGYEIYGKHPNGFPAEVCRINNRRRGAHRGESVQWIEERTTPANVALIVAAPDLLSVCKQLIAWNDGCDGDRVTHENIAVVQLQIIQAARAAIAKAAGSDPDISPSWPEPKQAEFVADKAEAGAKD